MTSGTKHSVDVGPQPWPPLSLPCTGFAMHQGLQLIKNLAAEQASALRRSCSAQFVSSKPPYCTVCVWRASCLCLCTSASCRAEESWKKGVRCSLLLHAELDTIAFRCGSHLGYHSVGTQLSCLHSFLNRLHHDHEWNAGPLHFGSCFLVVSKGYPLRSSEPDG